MLSAESSSSSKLKAPVKRITVKSLLSSRYTSGRRPSNWDERIPGFDKVLTTDGEEISLMSNGQQSPPQPGWTILLTGEKEEGSYSWTLYGIAP